MICSSTVFLLVGRWKLSSVIFIARGRLSISFASLAILHLTFYICNYVMLLCYVGLNNMMMACFIPVIPIIFCIYLNCYWKTLAKNRFLHFVYTCVRVTLGNELPYSLIFFSTGNLQIISISLCTNLQIGFTKKTYFVILNIVDYVNNILTNLYL